jgi:hypothetical protein
MNLQSRKINFVQEFLKLNNEKVISKLEKLLKDEKSKLPTKPLSLKQLNSMIDKAEDDSKQNRKKNVRQLKKEVNSWK